MTFRIDKGMITSKVKEIPDVISIKLNDEWKEVLAELQILLEQEKTSTIIKQSLLITTKVLNQDLQQTILGVVFENKRKNKRLGIIEFEV